MKQIERVEAIRFHQIMTAGRTTPLLLTCETQDGGELEAVVKFASGATCPPSSLCAELISSQLAADLLLPTPTPVVVDWQEEFAESLQGNTERDIVLKSRPPAFGSTNITGGFSTWPAGGSFANAEARKWR